MFVEAKLERSEISTRDNNWIRIEIMMHVLA